MTVTAPSPGVPSADDAPWLTAEQQQWWRAYLTGAARLTEALGRQLERDAGLSLSEYEVMVRLSEAPDRTLRMAELADSLVHSRSRLTHTVARMERRGLVARRACPADGRGINATLTDAGMAALVAAAPGHVRAVREHLVDRLSDDEFRALGRAMAAISGPTADATASA
ncbi:MarR family transcriptional regulator [Isoptericola sp. b441]|uniref:MarR family transcriptional regulator n=1 Tax=Actinotalea lenta TaxID=3064654 RepID=A0ABT9D6M7_9CELL|nr:MULTISPECIES: MarR family transcriptional regulator [unclassified Isoptericola]MDO8106490.1 MarR family transcriptional regulator [Isoptericola sp. b441]MDO8121794.1 MarR family transcriptional regulator [Isoptericola sp. b490]